MDESSTVPTDPPVLSSLLFSQTMVSRARVCNGDGAEEGSSVEKRATGFDVDVRLGSMMMMMIVRPNGPQALATPTRCCCCCCCCASNTNAIDDDDDDDDDEDATARLSVWTAVRMACSVRSFLFITM